MTEYVRNRSIAEDRRLAENAPERVVARSTAATPSAAIMVVEHVGTTRRKQGLTVVQKAGFGDNPKPTRLDRRMSQISGEAVLSCGHQLSVAPTNLKPVKSDFTNGMSGGVESDRAKHEVQVGRVILFKDYRRQSLQLHAAFHHPNWIRA